MGHCLGRYGLSCAFERMTAVSVRTGGGYRLSSAVLRIAEKNRIEIVDHRGYQNTTPDPRTARALKDYIAAIEEDISLFEHFESARGSRLAVHGHVPEVPTPSHFYFAPAREWIFRAYYAPLLPPSEAALGRDEWLELKGLRQPAEEWAVELCGGRQAAAA